MSFQGAFQEAAPPLNRCLLLISKDLIMWLFLPAEKTGRCRLEADLGSLAKEEEEKDIV